MKRNNRNRTRIRTLFPPVKVELTDADIMADLLYPEETRRLTARPAGKRNLNR